MAEGLGFRGSKPYLNLILLSPKSLKRDFRRIVFLEYFNPLTSNPNPNP